MENLIEQLTQSLPGCGFTLIAIGINNGSGVGSYISNVKDGHMIKVLEHQIFELKNKVNSKGNPLISKSFANEKNSLHLSF